MNRGLKLSVSRPLGNSGKCVTKEVPMNRGLKPVNAAASHQLAGFVTKEVPMNRGLKPSPVFSFPVLG